MNAHNGNNKLRLVQLINEEILNKSFIKSNDFLTLGFVNASNTFIKLSDLLRVKLIFFD